MINTKKLLDLPWAGVFGGAFFWYLAHEIGFYFSDYHCKENLILPSIHVISLLGSIASGVISFRVGMHRMAASNENKYSLTTGINVAAATLFSIVIIWQLIATFVYSGCAR